MAHDVFLSYSSKDKAAAEAACRALEAARVKVWMTPRDILPGSGWAQSINRAIAEARALVLLLSVNANGSSHVEREVELAAGKGLTIVTARLEDVQPNEALQYFVGPLHWFDAFPEPHGPHFERLATNVKLLLLQDGGRRPDAEAAEARMREEYGRHGTPTPRLMRELREVERCALALFDHLDPERRHNVAFGDFPVESTRGLCEMLMALPEGSTCGCRKLLEYARARLPEIRGDHIPMEDVGAVGDDGAPLGLARGDETDGRIAMLIVSVTTALSTLQKASGVEIPERGGGGECVGASRREGAAEARAIGATGRRTREGLAPSAHGRPGPGQSRMRGARVARDAGEPHGHARRRHADARRGAGPNWRGFGSPGRRDGIRARRDEAVARFSARPAQGRTGLRHREDEIGGRRGERDRAHDQGEVRRSRNCEATPAAAGRASLQK